MRTVRICIFNKSHEGRFVRMHVAHVSLHCRLLMAAKGTEVTLKARRHTTLLPLVSAQVTFGLVALPTSATLEWQVCLRPSHQRVKPALKFVRLENVI